MSNAAGDFQEHYWGSWDQVETFRHRAAIELVQRGPVLDVGAGDGFFLALLKKERALEGVGVDLSSEAAEKASRKGLVVHVADVSDGKLPFGDGAFETVVLLDVLEHFFRPQDLLKAVHRVTATHAVIGVPNFSSLPARLQVMRGRVPENNKPRKGHVYWFSWKVLGQQLADAGFVIEELRCNANFARVPLLGALLQALAQRWPSLFALSFVVRARKR